MERPLKTETAAGHGRTRLLRVATLVAAALVLAVALAAPAFRIDGRLTGLFVVPVSLSVALALIALAGVSAWTLLAGLFLLGQAAALQLIRAGGGVAYQHWLPLGEASGTAMLVPVVQAVLVAAAYRWGRARDRFGPFTLRLGPRLLAVAGVFVLTGAALSREPTVYVTELLFAAGIQIVQLANLALAMAFVPADRIQVWSLRLERLTGSDSAGERSTIDRFVLVAAAWATAVAAVLAFFVYQAHPHIPDEVSFLMQARYFAAGQLSMPIPPVPEAFNLDLMTYEAARWYSPLTPAWPAALAVGVKLGVPWLVNPLLTGAAVLLAYLFVGALYDRRLARLTTLLLCVSPWFLYMGSNLMNHQWTLVWALLGALGVARARRSGPGRWPWLFAAGVALGVLAMLRPLEGLCMAVLLGTWALASGPDAGLRRLLPVAVLAAVSVLVSSLQLVYNRALTGAALRFPVMEYLHAQYGEGSNALGFGPDRGFGWVGLDPLPGHGAADVAINSMLNGFLVNVELLGWSIGSLLPVLVLLAWGRRQRQDTLMTIAILGVVVAHAFYWFNGGPDFGARYWYLILLPCLVLAVRGLETVGERIGRDNGAAGNTRAFAAAALLALGAMCTFMPWRAADKYYHYRNMRPDIRELAATSDFGDALVLIRGRRHPDYASAAVYNPLDLDPPRPVYAWDRDPEITARLIRAWPNRPIWVVDGPTRTGNGFRIMAGPLTAGRIPAIPDPGR